MKDIKVYSSPDNPGTSTKTAGFFGGAVVKSFPDLTIEDEGRLRNNNLREHFLTRIFTWPPLERRKQRPIWPSSIAFYSTNKLLLAAHSQKEAKVLGNIVGHPGEKGDFKAPGRVP